MPSSRGSSQPSDQTQVFWVFSIGRHPPSPRPAGRRPWTGSGLPGEGGCLTAPPRPHPGPLSLAPKPALAEAQLGRMWGGLLSAEPAPSPLRHPAHSFIQVLSQSAGFELSASHNKCPLVIYFTHTNACVAMRLPQFVPPSSSPPASTSLCFLCVGGYGFFCDLILEYFCFLCCCCC